MLAAFAACLLSVRVAVAAADGPADSSTVEFFEKQIRPLLAQNCLACHSSRSARQGGLALDSRAAMLHGGSRGAAIIPGQPQSSLLLRAVGYGDKSLQMPPSGELPASQRASLIEWIRAGAEWPDSAAAPVSAGGFDLQRRKALHWAWQPIRKPAVPRVAETAWVRNPIDAFILAGLQAKGLRPAPPADRRTLIRRVTFDLIGLPPTPAEVEAFTQDRSPDAYEKVVDRLLASPHYGERWARHWLDLARYAETWGHEEDFEKRGAYEYRDYVIRALNADLPYCAFVREQVAGDLMPSPRINPERGFNESVLGTGFWWMGEATHSPVNLLQDQADRIDNQIDVFGKAFLGLTLGCARCHDHKFDAISTRDYYALSGFLRSSRYQLAALDCATALQPTLDALERIKQKRDAVLGLEAVTGHKTPPPGCEVFEDFTGPTYAGWYVTGQAFGSGPSRWTTRTEPVGDSLRVERVAGPGVADSGALSGRLHGFLRSRTFTIAHPKILYHMAGLKCAVRLVVQGLQLIKDPIYGGLQIELNDERARWYTQDVSKWIGMRAYIELVDGADGHIAVDMIATGDTNAPQADANDQSMDRYAHTSLVDGPGRVELETLDAERAKLEAALPDDEYAPAMADGTGEDDRVHVRGSAAILGDLVPRRFLEACAGASTPSYADGGSGRLQLAEQLTEPTVTPILVRAIVNRLWQHHFGEGIVRTVDNLGARGEPPSNAALLEWLSATFIAPARSGAVTSRGAAGAAAAGNAHSSQPACAAQYGGLNGATPDEGCGWSLKRMQRLMVLSSTYRMSSAPTPAADAADPSDALVHRMPLRRLEAEAIRDSVLAVSGRLDPTLYGPSAAPFLTPYMDGRGRPDKSGPLDGAGRRSIYIGVRRNFLTPLLTAFDFPIPFTCIGRRSVSNVPAQALALMNNPFILQQAGVWADRLLSGAQRSTADRLCEMYMTAFARPPRPDEAHAAADFLAQETASLGEKAAWADLCHVLFNTKEFIFIQ